ncbi:MAG: hypothetical protein CMO81_12320 [Waddliaceae bacterium]|nr:hypothetical protein [Waddliaceae bacterium]
MLPQELLDKMGEAQDLQGWVSVDFLVEYDPIYNPELLELFIATPYTERSARAIHLKNQYELDLSNTLEPVEKAAYLNINHLLQRGTGLKFYELDMEGAVRYKQWVLESEFELRPGTDNTFDYNNLRLVRDYPEKVTRLTIGETQSMHSRLLLGQRIQGAKYSTDFQLRPDYVTEPISEFSFLLERDSTVEVFINGIEVATLRLKAGPVDLLDFPLSIGLNEVLLKIIDDTGREKLLSFNTIKGPSILAPGKKDFAFSLGVTGNGSEYSSDPVFSTFYRQGISETFTASAEFQAQPDHIGIGGGFDWANPWFNTSGDIALSSTPLGTGLAMRTWISRAFKPLQLSGRLDFRTENYFTHSETNESDRIKTVAELSVLVPRIYNFGSLRFRSSHISRWLGETEMRQDLIWNYTLSTSWNFRANISYSNQDPSFELKFTVNYVHKTDTTHRTHSLQRQSNQFNLRSEMTGYQEFHGVDWNASHNFVLPDERELYNNVRGSVRYTGNRFVTFYRARINDLLDEEDLQQTLSLRSSLTWADGHFAVGLPIDNSFALIVGGEGLDQMNLLVNSAGKRFRATPRMGAVAPNLREYSLSKVSVSAESDSYEFEDYAFKLFSKYKSGFLIKVATEEEIMGTALISAYLLDQFEQNLSLCPVIINFLDRPESEPRMSFTNGEGFIRMSGLSPGEKYELQVNYKDEDLKAVQLYYYFEIPEDIGRKEYELGFMKPKQVLKEKPKLIFVKNATSAPYNEETDSNKAPLILINHAVKELPKNKLQKIVEDFSKSAQSPYGQNTSKQYEIRKSSRILSLMPYYLSQFGLPLQHSKKPHLEKAKPNNNIYHIHYLWLHGTPSPIILKKEEIKEEVKVEVKTIKPLEEISYQKFEQAKIEEALQEDHPPMEVTQFVLPFHDDDDFPYSLPDLGQQALL